MPARQYIGARYVTKVYENSLDPGSAEWEAGINYEPLTLVTYNMGSYLSKKEVPASVGDPASNPQYWVQTGFYNGQIAYLDNKKLDRYSQGSDDWDTTPTEDSTKAITSGGVFDSISGKVDIVAVTRAAIETIGENAIENHSSNTFFLATDGKYYRATTAISAGSPITLNTNCVLTTIAEQQHDNLFPAHKAKLFVPLGGLNSGETLTVTFSGAFRGVLFGFHQSAPSELFAILIAGGSTMCSAKDLSDHESLIISTSANVLTITNNGSYTSIVRLLVIDGDTEYTYNIS